MPIQSSSLLGGSSGSSGISLKSPSRQSILPKSYDWLADQDWSAERFTSGTSPSRPGTLAGGFTFSQIASLAQSRPVTPDPPRLTQSILNGKTQSAKFKVGQLQIREVAPFDFLAQLTGEFIGNEQPMIGENGSWFDPYRFFEEKQIDFNNAPSRLADYMVAGMGLPVMLAQTIAGLPMPTVAPRDQQYSFQLSPNYWPYVTQATDDDLKALAVKVVSKYADPTTNQYLVDNLIAQFKIDRNKQGAWSSGSDSADYFAKKALSWASRKGPLPANPSGVVAASQGYLYGEDNQSIGFGAAGIFRNVPFLSHAWASTVNPLTKEDEARWAAATPQQRAAMLGAVGLNQTINEAPGMLLGFAAGGTVAGSIAAGVKGTATVGGRALQVWNTALNLSKASMALGVTSATATWAAAAAFPDNEMIQNLTQRIDRSRPISESHLAGAVNAMGMFSSGTFGINTAVRMNAKVAAMAGAKMPVGIQTISRGALGGMPNLRFYEYGFGGSRMADFMVEKVGLPLQEVKVGVQRTFLSYTLNALRRMNDEGWVAALDNPSGTPLAGMTTDQILELQALHASHSLETVTTQAEAILRTMARAREDQPLGLWKNGDEAIKGYGIAVRNSRSWDDGMARSFISEYDSGFITRTTGADTGEAMRAWLATKLTGLGYSADALPSVRQWSTEQWRQATRMVYHFDFNRWADTVNAAAGGADEASHISIMSMRHLFRDEADRALAVLRGDDADAALAMMEQIKTKIEVETWNATEIKASARKGAGAPIWEATPAKLADHIEDIRETLSTRRGLPDPDSPTALDALNYVHREMETEGLWTIGFKPVNEAGDFVLSVQTRTGHVVESRWLDYPLDNEHLVDIGNRGFLSAKMDDVTRGFRTWRLLEYQKGSLFRSLTDRTDLSATQIETFHQGVMDLARKHNVSPQAVGRLPSFAPGLRSVAQEVNDLADRVFGGVVKDKEGNVINWKREVGNAYRQAYRLNLTAGVTSHIKANFGPVGEWITYGTDALYVMWRFGMSPLFKAGEIWESHQLNLMRRVYPGQDPYVMSLYARYGAGSDPAVIASERTLDPFIAGMDSTVVGSSGVRSAVAPANVRVLSTSSAATEAAHRRAAQSLAFYARQMPENQQQVIARTAMAEQAKRYREMALGGEAIRTTDRGRLLAELANSVDENGRMIAGTDQARLFAVLRQLNREDLDPIVAAALDAHPWGAPTAEQIAHSQQLANQAAVVRAVTDDTVIEQTWRQMIADGYAPPDAALALRDRYDELLTTLRSEREINRQWRAGNLTISTSGHPDLTDPVTGLPVIRDVLYSGEAEYSTAIRSLSQRRRHVKVTLPTPEDLAIRLEAAADTAVQPRPTFRSDHVGPEGTIPEGFTTDPVDLYLEGENNHSLDPDIGVAGDVWDANGNLILSTKTREGVASWIDLNTHDPATAGLYHVTTAHDAVMDTGGLKSRSEVLIERRPPDMVAAIDKAYHVDGLAPWDIRFKMVGKPDFQKPDGHDQITAFLNGDQGWIRNDNYENMFPQNIEEIWNANDGTVIWRRPKEGIPRVPEGLSANTPDTKVSFSTNKEHSDAIARGYIVGGMVARGEVGVAGVVDYYLPMYEKLIQTALDRNVHSLAANQTVRAQALEAIYNAVGIDSRGVFDEQALYDNLIPKMEANIPSGVEPGKGEWSLFDTLDRDLGMEKGRIGLSKHKDVFSGSVVYAKGWDVARHWTPEQVAVLQVAVRNNRLAGLDVDEAASKIMEAFDANAHGGSIRVQLADGSNNTWIRWNLAPQWATDGSMIPIAERTLGGETEAEAFRKWWDDLANNARAGNEEDQITAILAQDDTVIAGQPHETWDRQTKTGKDPMEIEVHSSNIYVIDRRIDAEPLATDAEGLLRQLRQVSDENGNPIPGYEKRYNQIVHDATRLRDESLNPDPVTSMEDIPEEPAGMTRNLRDRIRARTGKAAEEFFDPVPGKERKMDKLVTQMQREEFPRVMAGTGLEKVFIDLGIPEQARADFLVVDRDLLERWQASGSADDFQRLIDHAGGVEDRAALDAFYNSEEWDVISGLWRLNLKGASEEAFGVHFFDQYRSPLLRGMNHPVLGVYPAAWAIKTAREWAKFMFDNRMFGVDLRLGMTPAVAVANITRSQQIAFAQQNPEYDGTLEEFMQEGPLGSTIFIFNLLMPGDWSALPFPLSRTIREILRNPTAIDPGDLLAKNVQYMGVTRDVRLGWEMLNEVKDLAFPPEPEPNLPRTKTWSSAPKRSTPKWYDVPTR